jgi:hypothetical protein
MHKIMNKKFYLSPKFGTLINKSWSTISELLHSLIFLWPAVVARGRKWGARWRSVLEAAREFLPWRLCAALGKGRPRPCRCLCFLRPAVEARGQSRRRVADSHLPLLLMRPSTTLPSSRLHHLPGRPWRRGGGQWCSASCALELLVLS